MGRLTTHVLDTALGKPGAGIRLELYCLDAGRVLAAGAVTNNDGRCPQPLLEGDAFRAGRYELVFFAGAYLSGLGTELPQPPFLDEIVIRFGVATPEAHYHVPLLLSPYGYATYRGS